MIVIVIFYESTQCDNFKILTMKILTNINCVKHLYKIVVLIDKNDYTHHLYKPATLCNNYKQYLKDKYHLYVMLQIVYVNIHIYILK